jgi:hypothetical protein
MGELIVKEVAQERESPVSKERSTVAVLLTDMRKIIRVENCGRWLTLFTTTRYMQGQQDYYRINVLVCQALF